MAKYKVRTRNMNANDRWKTVTVEADSWHICLSGTLVFCADDSSSLRAFAPDEWSRVRAA